VLSAHDEQLYAERALKAGALGYVMKDCPATDLLAAVRRVASGMTYVSDETAERILSTLGPPRRRTDASRSPLERLSNREHRVLTLLGQGLSTREIAGTLAVSVKTVESHFAHLKIKLGARNGRELTRLAVSWTGVASPSAPPPLIRERRPAG
jgi:DNA-binding NarL/FixJ family response regulator